MKPDADPLSRPQAAGIALTPVRAGRSLMQEVGVDVDEHVQASRASAASTACSAVAMSAG